MATENNTFKGETLNDGARYFFIILGGAEVLCGVVGNWILLIVLLRKRSLSLRNVHNLLIANLALADLLSLGYYMPFMVIDLILQKHPVVDNAHCIFNGYLICTCVMVSVMSLMCISFNRYLNVCHPQILSKIVTLRRTVISCLLCWIISLIVVMPLVIPDDNHKQHLGYNIKSHTCTFDKNRDDIYEYGRAVMLIMTYLPLFFVGYWNFSIFRKWRRKRMTTASKYPTIEREQRRRERVVIAWRTNSVNISARNNTESVQNGHEKYTKISIDELSQSPPVEDSQSKGAPSEQTDPRSQAQANRDCKATPLSPVIKRLRDSKTHLSHDKSLSNHLQQLHRRALKRRAAERALVRSLFVVFILMFAAFVPFSIINTVNITEDISPEISITGDLMLFFNNAVNWIVYGVMNRSFKRAYLKSLRSLCCICCKRPTNPSTDHTSVSLQSNVNTAVILKSVEEPTSSSEDDANVTFEQGDHDVSSTYF